MIADTFFKRLKGLMFTKGLPEQSGLHIIPCSEIHTFNMYYPIDVLYLDANNNILAIDEELKPNRIGKHIKNAVSVVELSNGKIKKLKIEVGQAVVVQM